jgi:hypothetical protein
VRNGLGTTDYDILEATVPDTSYYRFQFDPRPVRQRFAKLFKKDPVVPERGFNRTENVDLATLR